MNEREIAEKIVKQDGNCGFMECDDCPLEEMTCHNDAGAYGNAKRWLKDNPKEITMIKLNTPKEVHEAMWKDGARWTSWDDKTRFIKFNEDGDAVIDQYGVEEAIDKYAYTNNSNGHFWTPYIPPKKEQMTDDEMLEIIAKKPWINHKDRIYNDFLITEIDSVARIVYWDAGEGHIPFNVLKSDYLYSFDLIEWKEFVK